MLCPDELRDPDEIGFLIEQAPDPQERERRMTDDLVTALSVDRFNPGIYRDQYPEALLELIDAKLAGREAAVPAPRIEAPTDLVAALQASIDQARAPR